MSNSPGLVDFAIRLVNSVLYLPDGQAKIFRRIKITKVLFDKCFKLLVNSCGPKVAPTKWNLHKQDEVSHYMSDEAHKVKADIFICEQRKQQVLILNSSEKFIMVLANIGHVRFNMVNSKHRCYTCLLIPHRIVFTFHKNLSDEKLPEMKQTFLFFWNLKPLVTCNKMNLKFA